MGTQRYTLNSGQRGNLRDSLQPAATDSGKLSSPKGPQTPTALKEEYQKSLRGPSKNKNR